MRVSKKKFRVVHSPTGIHIQMSLHPYAHTSAVSMYRASSQPLFRCPTDARRQRECYLHHIEMALAGFSRAWRTQTPHLLSKAETAQVYMLSTVQFVCSVLNRPHAFSALLFFSDSSFHHIIQDIWPNYAFVVLSE